MGPVDGRSSVHREIEVRERTVVQGWRCKRVGMWVLVAGGGSTPMGGGMGGGGTGRVIWHEDKEIATSRGSWRGGGGMPVGQEELARIGGGNQIFFLNRVDLVGELRSAIETVVQVCRQGRGSRWGMGNLREGEGGSQIVFCSIRLVGGYGENY